MENQNSEGIETQEITTYSCSGDEYGFLQFSWRIYVIALLSAKRIKLGNRNVGAIYFSHFSVFDDIMQHLFQRLKLLLISDESRYCTSSVGFYLCICGHVERYLVWNIEF